MFPSSVAVWPGSRELICIHSRVCPLLPGKQHSYRKEERNSSQRLTHFCEFLSLVQNQPNQLTWWSRASLAIPPPTLPQRLTWRDGCRTTCPHSAMLRPCSLRAEAPGAHGSPGLREWTFHTSGTVPWGPSNQGNRKAKTLPRPSGLPQAWGPGDVILKWYKCGTGTYHGAGRPVW